MGNIKRKVQKDYFFKLIVIIWSFFIVFAAGFCLYHWAWQKDVSIPAGEAIGAVYMRASGWNEPEEFKRNLMAEAVYLGNDYAGSKLFHQPYNCWKDIWPRYVEAGIESFVNGHTDPILEELWEEKRESERLFYQYY